MCVLLLKRSQFDPHRVWQHSFVEIDGEIFSTIILSFSEEGQKLLFLSSKECAHVLISRLEN